MVLQERAKEFISKIASGTSQEMDYYANLLVEFANETTKKLQEDLKHKKIAIQNRKARIKDLEKQIEKMKCCENCAYRTVDLLSFKPFCDKRKLEIENPLTCKCDKWKSVN